MKGLAIRSPVLITAAILVASIASYGPARSQTLENGCLSQPNPECLLKLAHQEEQELEQPFERVVTLTRIAVAESLAGFPKEAVATFARALEIVGKPGLAGDAEVSDTQTFTATVIYLMPSSGMRTLSDLPMLQSEEYMRSMLRKFMVTAQVEAGRSVDNVELFIQRLDTPEDGPDFYLAAAKAYASAEKTDEARFFVLAAAKKAKNQTAGDIPLRTLDDIISLQTKIGDQDEAIATLRDPGVQLDTMTRIRKLTVIARQQEKEGDRESALATLAIADEFIDTLEENEGREIMRDFFQRQEAVLTSESGNYIGGDTSRGGGRSTNSSAAGMAIAEAEFGNFETAVERALELDDQPERIHTLSSIAGIQAERGDAQGAHETATLITHDYMRLLAFQTIAEAQAKAGNFEGFRDTVGKIPNESIRYHTLTEGIWPLVEADATVGAASIARDLLLPAERAKAYVTMVLVMAKRATAGEKQGAD